VTPPRRGGLGRGLGALIIDTSSPKEPAGPGADRLPTAALDLIDPPDRAGDAEPVLAGTRYREIPVDSISANPRQPREHFDEDALAELVASIREVGLLQPVVVRETSPGLYELVMGERRWRACREAGLTTVPALIRETGDDRLLRDALLENLHRVDLNPLEEAAAYAQLLGDFGATHEELAVKLARSRSHVTNTLRLMHLSSSVQRRVAAGVLSAGHARALLGIDDAEAQERLAARIVTEGLSVRAVEEEVALLRTSPKARARVPRSRPAPSPGLTELAEALSDRFDTRVSVSMGRAKGKIIVEFASPEDLQRILGAMAPGSELVRAPGALADVVEG